MSIKKSLACVAAGSLAFAGLGIAGAMPAGAASATITTLNAAPVNNIGTTAYPSNTASIVATQSGADVNLTITMSTGPQASAANGDAGSYQYEFDIIDTTSNTVVLSGDQCETDGAAATHTFVPLGSFYPGVGGASTIPALVCTVTAPSVGAHNYDILNLNVQSNGPSSGGSFSPRIGFDANVSRLAAPSLAANIDATTKVPVPAQYSAARWGVNEAISVVGANFAVSSVTGQNAGVTAYARTGNTVVVTGNTWTPSGAITAVTVGGVAAPSNTLSVDALGNLTGGLEVPVVGNGLRAITITQGSKSASTDVTILGTPTVVTPASGAAGGLPFVTGSDFNPGDTITISQLDNADNVIAGTTVTQAASATGGLNQQITLNAGVKKIRVSDSATGFTTDNVITLSLTSCTAQTGAGGTGSCATEQQTTATVLPGSLAQALTAKVCSIGDALSGTYKPAPPAPAIPIGVTCNGVNPSNAVINFGSVQLAATATNIGAVMNTARVVDTRGIVDNWSLTASLSDNLISGSNSIAKSKMVIAPTACADTTVAETFPGSGVFVGNSAPTTLGTGAPLSSAVTLCTNSAVSSQLNAAGSTGGSYDVDASLRLQIPAFQAVGTYTSTLVLTLA
jgi:hypothetical protein